METLEQRLARISQETKNNKEAELQSAQEQELKPIREKIKELEEQKYRFEVIKGSLDIKSNKDSGKESGKGMKEVAQETEAELNNQAQKLDGLMEKYKDAVEALGIQNREQFLDNAEFADTPEVVSYKEAKEKVESVKLSNSALEKKLTQLGVSVDDDNFSYESAEALLLERMESIDNELVAEKLKTPEGREEVLDLVAEKLERMLLTTSLSKQSLNSNLEFNFNNTSGYNRRTIVVSKERAKFERLDDALQMLPQGQGLDQLEQAYGKELVEQALKKAYNSKIEKEFKKYDKANDNLFELKEVMQANGPEQRREAQDAFYDLRNENKRQLDEGLEKMDEIFLNSKELRGDGSSKELLRNIFDERRIERLGKHFDKNTDVFPPEWDWKKLLAKIQKLQEIQKGFLEDLNSLKTDEEHKQFFDWKSKYNGEKGVIHYNRALSRLDDTYAEFKLPLDYQKSDQFKKEYPTIARFNTFLNESVDKLQQSEEKTKEVVGVAVDISLKKREFGKALEEQKFGGQDVEQFGNEVTHINNMKRDAQYALEDLAKFEVQLPNEELELRGNNIFVPSRKEAWDKMGEELQDGKNELAALVIKIAEHEKNEPRLFGKADWQNTLTELKTQKTQLEKDNEAIVKKRTEAYPSITIRIPESKNYNINQIYKDQKEVKGSATEILAEIRKKLAEYTERAVPAELMQTAKEYQALKEKLTK